MKHLFLLF